ncbi:MAG: HupE/UreJ family protein [Pseudomonadota bacterium]
MDRFWLYLRLGFEHISDLAGYDHILFLVALCAVYRLSQWRNILILVTAFTVGHSVTLAIASLGSVPIPARVVEFLIATTIVATAAHNVVGRGGVEAGATMWPSYLMALFFGFIHGLGFSNYFRALLMNQDAIALPLFSFNVGVELGQLLVVAVIVAVAALVTRVFGARQRDWNLVVSGAAGGIGLTLMQQSWPF